MARVLVIPREGAPPMSSSLEPLKWTWMRTETPSACRRPRTRTAGAAASPGDAAGDTRARREEQQQHQQPSMRRGPSPGTALPWGLDCLAGGDCCKSTPPPPLPPPHLVTATASGDATWRPTTITVSTVDGRTGTIRLWRKAKRPREKTGTKRRNRRSRRGWFLLLLPLLFFFLLVMGLMKMEGPSWWTAALLPALGEMREASKTEAEVRSGGSSAPPLPPPPSSSLPLPLCEPPLPSSLLLLHEGDGEKVAVSAQLRGQMVDAGLEEDKNEKEEGESDEEEGECGAMIAAQSVKALRLEMMELQRALRRVQRAGYVSVTSANKQPLPLFSHCSSSPSQSSSPSVKEEELELELLPDFASELAGGSIVATPRTNAFVSGAWETLWGIPVWRRQQSPRVIIQRGGGGTERLLEPGACWAFEGGEGRVVVALATAARVAAVGVEHVTTVVAGSRHSAPRRFQVTGLVHSTDDADADAEGAVPLGRFEYDLAGPQRQTFAIRPPSLTKFAAVQLHVLSNHGNPRYTCLYRFRVHGFNDDFDDNNDSYAL